MTRVFLRPDDVRDLVRDRLGTDRRVTALDRLTGGTCKGVYRTTLDDGTTVVLYVWSAEENYWPASATVPDDPFTEASGAATFATNHAALTAAGVRVPHLIAVEPAGRHLDADVALVEDAGDVTLEALLTRDPHRAAEPLARLGDALRRMHTTLGPRWGRLTDTSPGAPPVRPAEDVVLDRALGHLAGAAARDPRPAAARDRIAAHLRGLRDRVPPRQAYALVHGELGPDHVLVTPGGEPVLIDIEGLTWFDVEWEHAWLRLRFGAAYPALRPVALDADRLEFYRYAQVLALIEGPLRIATGDFPDRRWMLDLAERNIAEALAPL
ncbi:phosphotransferase [Micromonospora sp. WMMC241]|uniref:phosphotransferase family protein n=1 Tax=Micromonospora sp. WMMC241 TaxID=3015159 RepID=UPI0022B617CC|nr:phosphotransferase [Micromonospora sp. WMMC241]MCZ7438665.1 phosphotransferase [Micromonospora sp. WMMC241]